MRLRYDEVLESKEEATRCPGGGKAFDNGDKQLISAS
jgi:hypothetical protein